MVKKKVKKFSGRITVRVSESLHKKLVKKADKEGVSLNLLLNNVIVEGTK